MNEFRRDFQIKQISRRAKLLQFDFETQDDAPELAEATLAEFRAAIQEGQGEAPILVNTATGQSTRIEQLLDACMSSAKSLNPGSNQRTFLLKFPSQTVALGSIPITVYLATAKVILEIEVAKWVLEDVKLHQYASEQDVLLEVASADTDTARHGRVNLEVVFTRGTSPPDRGT